MKKISGFTLIEILVALAIFAILASLTSTVLYTSFKQREVLNQQTKKLEQLELSLALMQKSFRVILNRPIHGENFQSYPAFIGKNSYLEFSHASADNFFAKKRTKLRRVAYYCHKGRLLERSSAYLDSPSRKTWHERVLLAQLKDCQFYYYDRFSQELSQWRQGNRLPQAVALKLTFNQDSSLSYLFAIPEAVYAN